MSMYAGQLAQSTVPAGSLPMLGAADAAGAEDWAPMPQAARMAGSDSAPAA